LTVFFAEPKCIRTERSDGSILYRSQRELRCAAASVLDWVRRWAEETPNATAVAERDPNDGAWRAMTYRELLHDARALAAELKARGHHSGARASVLAANGVDHLRAAIAAYVAGIVYVPIAPQYANSAGKLGAILDILRPSLIFIDRRTQDRAFSDLDLHGAEVIGIGAELDAAVVAGRSLSETRFAPVDPDAPAKILMTSGSTGAPKAVICTQTTMVSNMYMTLDAWPFLQRRRPVLLDWLPWNHAFGGNHNLHTVLSLGGTLYIDDGGASAGGIGRTMENLAEHLPTAYSAVPSAIAQLLDGLDAAPALRGQFFRSLDALFSAGAGMSNDLWSRLTAVAKAERGNPLPILAGWGSTECGPGATLVQEPMLHPAGIGVPLAGVEIKLAPHAGKYELRVRSASVSPGYWSDEIRTRAAFDEEGFYRTGDAGRFADEQNPDRGLLFDGRLAEDFKLATGTWVNVARLRVAMRELFPEANEVALFGESRAESRALVWIGTIEPSEIIRKRMSSALRSHNERSPSSGRVMHVRLLPGTPSASVGEVNAKGDLDARTVAATRSEELEKLWLQEASVE
jgi:feruloyl-CoA synthase